MAIDRYAMGTFLSSASVYPEARNKAALCRRKWGTRRGRGYSPLPASGISGLIAAADALFHKTTPLFTRIFVRKMRTFHFARPQAPSQCAGVNSSARPVQRDKPIGPPARTVNTAKQACRATAQARKAELCAAQKGPRRPDAAGASKMAHTAGRRNRTAVCKPSLRRENFPARSLNWAVCTDAARQTCRAICAHSQYGETGPPGGGIGPEGRVMCNTKKPPEAGRCRELQRRLTQPERGTAPLCVSLPSGGKTFPPGL